VKYHCKVGTEIVSQDNDNIHQKAKSHVNSCVVEKKNGLPF